MNNIKQYAVLISVVLIVITGCQPSGDTAVVTTEKKQPKTVAPKKDGNVLVKVNGEPIYEQELELTITTMLNQKHRMPLDKEVRKKVLESLVLSRAMAQAAVKELKVEELAEIKSVTRLYRDQLLVKRYLQRNSALAPITDEMVRAYYEEHQDRFEKTAVRTYELMTESEQSNGERKNSLMQLLQTAKHKNNWKSYAAQLAAQGYAIQFQSGEENNNLLHPALTKIMQPLKKGQISPVTYISGKAYVVRIVSDKKKTARLLQDVRAEIRRMLVPVQIRKAVKQASDAVLATTQVEYVLEKP